MIFTNDQNFVDRPNMMIKCSKCDKVLHKSKHRGIEDIKGFLIRESKQYQINYCSNCGHKLTIPNEVEDEPFCYGLGLGKPINKN